MLLVPLFTRPIPVLHHLTILAPRPYNLLAFTAGELQRHSRGVSTGPSMAGESKGPLRHIVLLKVERKEDVPEVVETLANMSKEIVKHGISWLSFDVSSDLGISGGNADVGLVIDFPDEENFHLYQKHDLHVAAVTHNKKFVLSRTAIQMSLPKSSL